MCLAVQSGLRQVSNDSERQPEHTLFVFNKYYTIAGASVNFQKTKNEALFDTKQVLFYEKIAL